MFPKVTNIHLYIDQKKIKQENFIKSTHHMIPDGSLTS
jgi:hypothetical protein